MDARKEFQHHHTLTEQVKQEAADFEFVEIDIDTKYVHQLHQLCTACLCATRTTHALGDVTLKQYYMNILTETQLEASEPVLQSPRLCWECVAHLKRSVRFREQVQDSYRLLQPMLLMCDKENLAEFLQTSVCRPARLSTCRAYSIDVSPQDDVAQLMTADEDDGDDKAAAMEGLEVVVASLPSTSRETGAAVDDESVESFCDENIDVRVSEDLDEQLEDSDAQTRKQDTSLSVTNSGCEESTHELKRFQCNACPKSFAQKYNLVMHRRTQHANKKPFQCEVCHKSFAGRRNLTNHIRTHTGEKPFPCDKCLKSFTYKYELVNHIRTHTGDKPFQCEVCKKSFAYKSLLVSHGMTHTVEKQFQCDVCPKSFAQKGGLTLHRRTHTGEKPFQCEVCDKSFSAKYQLKIHRRTQHTSDKPFQCELCQLSFAMKRRLKMHMKSMHLNERPFKCKICVKAYVHAYELRKHNRLHTGEKPFQCEFCKKGFTNNNVLRTHRRTHTGEKPFQCKVCLRSFAQSGSMHTHMRTHTGEKPYQCEVCGQAFSLKPHMLSHVKTHKGKTEAKGESNK